MYKNGQVFGQASTETDHYFFILLPCSGPVFESLVPSASAYMAIIGLCTAVILALCSRTASTHTLGTPVWNSPCSLPLPVIGTFQQNLQAESPPLADVLWSVVETANSVRRRARQILRVLEWNGKEEKGGTRRQPFPPPSANCGNEYEEIRDPWIIRHLNHIPGLTGFPSLNRNYTFQSPAESLPLDYERLSSAAVFLEQAQLDTNIRSYSYLLRVLFYDVTSLLCWLEQASLVLGQTVNYDVTRDIMADSLRTLTNQADRDQRNFLIIRDTMTLLSDIARFYSKSLTSH